METITRQNKVGINSNYMIIESLPSAQRSYQDINQILVRGLLFDEVKSLSKYVGNDSTLRKLVNAYKDVIILSNTETKKTYPLDTLELVDFHYLMSVSSIYTTDESKVTFEYACPNCESTQAGVINLEDLQYNVEFKDIKDGKVPIKSGTYFVHPHRVLDLIKLDDSDILLERYNKRFNLELESDTFKELLGFAISLDWKSDEDLFRYINIINSDVPLTKEITQVTDELSTDLTPIPAKCASCGTETKLKFDFMSVRGYL